MVVDFPTDAVAGARRTPGRLKTGGVPPKPPATIFISLWPSVFWDFGSLFRTLRRHFLTRCRGSRLIRPRRCGDFGLVSRHKPAEHHFLMFPPRNCQCTRSSCRVEAKTTEKFSRSSASSVFPVRFNVISANCCGSGQTISRRCGVPGAGCCGSGAQTILRHSPPPPPSARAKSP